MIKSETKAKTATKPDLQAPCLVESSGGSVILLTEIRGQRATGVVLHSFGNVAFPIGTICHDYSVPLLKEYTGELLLRNE